MWALFSPEILQAGAVKGLIADSDGKPKEKNEETENRRRTQCRHLHGFLLACSQDVMRIKTARNLYIKQLNIYIYTDCHCYAEEKRKKKKKKKKKKGGGGGGGGGAKKIVSLGSEHSRN